MSQAPPFLSVCVCEYVCVCSCPSELLFGFAGACLHCNDHGKGIEARDKGSGNGNCRGHRQVSGVEGEEELQRGVSRVPVTAIEQDVVVVAMFLALCSTTEELELFVFALSCVDTFLVKHAACTCMCMRVGVARYMCL